MVEWPPRPTFPTRNLFSELSDELVVASAVRPAGERLRALFPAGVRARFGRPCLVR